MTEEKERKYVFSSLPNRRRLTRRPCSDAPAPTPSTVVEAEAVRLLCLVPSFVACVGGAHADGA